MCQTTPSASCGWFLVLRRDKTRLFCCLARETGWRSTTLRQHRKKDYSEAIHGRYRQEQGGNGRGVLQTLVAPAISRNIMFNFSISLFWRWSVSAGGRLTHGQFALARRTLRTIRRSPHLRPLRRPLGFSVARRMAQDARRQADGTLSTPKVRPYPPSTLGPHWNGGAWGVMRCCHRHDEVVVWIKVLLPQRTIQSKEVVRRSTEQGVAAASP